MYVFVLKFKDINLLYTADTGVLNNQVALSPLTDEICTQMSKGLVKAGDRKK